MSRNHSEGCQGRLRAGGSNPPWRGNRTRTFTPMSWGLTSNSEGQRVLKHARASCGSRRDGGGRVGPTANQIPRLTLSRSRDQLHLQEPPKISPYFSPADRSYLEHDPHALRFTYTSSGTPGCLFGTGASQSATTLYPRQPPLTLLTAVVGECCTAVGSTNGG